MIYLCASHCFRNSTMFLSRAWRGCLPTVIKEDFWFALSFSSWEPIIATCWFSEEKGTFSVGVWKAIEVSFIFMAAGKDVCLNLRKSREVRSSWLQANTNWWKVVWLEVSAGLTNLPLLLFLAPWGPDRSENSQKSSDHSEMYFKLKSDMLANGKVTCLEEATLQ